jgi:UDP-N-acetylglucosamine 1-carboxyvinyltransferase
MDSLIIEGGPRLRGSIGINGSKNAALPVMAGALLADGPTYLQGVPNLSDIQHQINLLRELGCEVERRPGSRGRGA